MSLRSFAATNGPVCTQLRKFGELVATPDLHVRLTCSVGHCRTECLQLEAFIKHLKKEHTVAVAEAFTAHNEEIFSRTADEARVAWGRVEHNYMEVEEEEGDNSNSMSEVQMEALFVKHEVDETALPEDELTGDAGEQQQSSDAEHGDYATSYDPLKVLLRRWQCAELYPRFKAESITIKNMRYLTESDLKELIAKIGKRAEFRYRLELWKKSLKKKHAEAIESDGSCSRPSELTVELKKKHAEAIESDGSCSRPSELTVELKKKHAEAIESDGSCSRTFELTVELKLLDEKREGRSVFSYYTRHQLLLARHRELIVNVILEDVNRHGVTLRPEQFAKLADNIKELFPNEIKDYYYTPRKPHGHPSGRLYTKFYNLRHRKQRLERAVTPIIEGTQDGNVKPLPLPLDIELLEKKRLALLQDGIEWNALAELWKQTFSLRLKDRANLPNLEHFMQRWRLYKQAYGANLIAMDFEKLFPDKGNLLLEKWRVMERKMIEYFRFNVKDPASMVHLNALEYIEDTDSIDFIIFYLLNAALPPRKRFKKKKRGSISEAQQYFIIHVSSVENVAQRIAVLREQCGEDDCGLQPFIVAQGTKDEYDLQKFYVQFDDTLYASDSLLKSVDLCFKIYRVFNLPYPLICYDLWLFLHRFIYELNPETDTHVGSLLNLISYLSKKT